MELAETLDDSELVAAIAHELGHVQNGHILYTTALHYLNTSAAFFVRWVIQPAIMTLQAWSRRAEITCDRASLLAVRDLDKTLTSLVRIEMGIEKGSAFNAEEYLRALPDVKKGIGRYTEIFRSHPYVPKRVQALRLFAGSALYAQVTGQDPTGKPTLSDVDKQCAELISVF
jgi:Zn-dependent protease with chaperone function